MEQNNDYRKISVFYADDRAENVEDLLLDLQESGILIPSSNDNEQLSTSQCDSDEIYNHNHRILNSDQCLISLDYSTRIQDSIAKIISNPVGFDLVICDLYFGEADREFKDSKIGGMWIILWAKHQAKDKKIVCKIYTGQLQKVKEHIDFLIAQKFIESEYKIEVEQVGKLQDSRCWHDSLSDYFVEVRQNIIPDIDIDDRIKFINLISSSFKHEIFQNYIEENRFEDFRKKLVLLKEFEFNFKDNYKMKLVHLFPYLIGRRFLIDDKDNFLTLNQQDLENELYRQEFEFQNKESAYQKSQELNEDNIENEVIKTHDLIGNPVYIIKVSSPKHHESIFTRLETPFIESLDYTYQIYRFYTRPSGFGYWSDPSQASPMGSKEFDRIRHSHILKDFDMIKDYFDDSLNTSDQTLGDQIKSVLLKIEATHFTKKRNLQEKQLQDKFTKLPKTGLYKSEMNDTTIPLSDLFRINISEFIKRTLSIQGGKDYQYFENDDFVRVKNATIYWYCNAYRVREGLKEIRSFLKDQELTFYLLETRDKHHKAIIQHRIIIEGNGRGLPSIARLFTSIDGQKLTFDQKLQNFCKLVIYSKMQDFKGISYNVYTDKDDVLCPELTEKGTRFEITIAQGREK